VVGDYESASCSYPRFARWRVPRDDSTSPRFLGCMHVLRSEAGEESTNFPAAYSCVLCICPGTRTYEWYMDTSKMCIKGARVRSSKKAFVFEVEISKSHACMISGLGSPFVLFGIMERLYAKIWKEGYGGSCLMAKCNTLVST